MKLLLLLQLIMVVLNVIIIIIIMTCFKAAAAADNSTLVNPTFLSDKKAVCLTGNRASYYFIPGSGDGLNNWLIVLPGGGWCENFTSCLNYSSTHGTDKPPQPSNNFDGILSSDKLANPDFYNWNKATVRYCDGSSFTGNSKKFYNGKMLYFRGARIFKAAVKELLAKGMKSARNALLAGESAGGVGTMLHCDAFRDLFPSSTRVKCLSDAGYFFPAKRHNYGNQSHFLSIFQGLIHMHRSIKALPRSCTQELSPALCFFGHNVKKYIKTPLFFIMSQFDYIELSYTTGLPWSYYTGCAKAKNCSSTQLEIMQDLRVELLDLLPKQNNSSPIGFLILSNVAHVHILEHTWYNRTDSGTQEVMAMQFGDWFFRGKAVQFIQGCSHPYGCG